jgi:hypothetical protein
MPATAQRAAVDAWIQVQGFPDHAMVTGPPAGPSEVGVVPDEAVRQGFQDDHQDGGGAQGQNPAFPRTLFPGQAEGCIARREFPTNASSIPDHVKVDSSAGISPDVAEG